MMPVFIGGCGRSGTTLLGAMLGAHSDCLCIPESQFKIDVLRSFSGNDKMSLADILDKIKRSWRFKIWGIDSRLDDSKELKTPVEIIELIIKLYGEKLGKLNSLIWVDHTNNNIRYSSLLFESFPKAKMIHLVRDGRAVAASIMPLDWGPNTIGNAAILWSKRELSALGMENLWKNRAMRIKYEDLLLEPEKTMKGLCSFLNIDYQSEMIKGIGFKVPFYTSNQHSLIGKGLDVSRANAWEKRLTSRQIEIFESIAGDLLLYYGYPLKYDLKAKKMTYSERLKSAIHETYRRNLINKFRHWYRIKKGVAKASLNTES